MLHKQRRNPAHSPAYSNRGAPVSRLLGTYIFSQHRRGLLTSWRHGKLVATPTYHRRYGTDDPITFVR
jgi:hypothetical protein